MRKKKGTDMIRPVLSGVEMAADLLARYPDDKAYFIAGVNWLLQLNGHDPVKIDRSPLTFKK